MLQWNTKFVLVIAVLIVLAAILGDFASCDALNFTW